MKSKRKTMKTMDYVKANRRGSRDAELENQSGWSAKHKVHRSDKTYSRKGRNKFRF